MSFIHRHIDHFLESTIGDAYCKSKKGIYLDVSNIIFREAIGKTDLDLIWHDQAPIMMRNDQEIIYLDRAKTFIEQGNFPNGQINSFLSFKFPITSSVNSHKKIGVFGISFKIEQADDLLHAFNEVSLLNKEPETQNLIKKFSPRLLARKHNLSPRQIECLSLLVRGKSMKEIASILKLSPRTVEHYLETAKIKLNCSTRSELIEKALSLGLGRL